MSITGGVVFLGGNVFLGGVVRGVVSITGHNKFRYHYTWCRTLKKPINQ